MASVVRFTEIVTGKVFFQKGDGDKSTRRQFSYAKKVATAEFLIELVVDGMVKDSHKVEYTPSPSEIGIK